MTDEEFECGTWFPKVLVVADDYTPDPRGSEVNWGRADIVVTRGGVVLKNKYGLTGWMGWKA